MNTRQIESQLTKSRRGEGPITETRDPVEMWLRLGVRNYGPSGLRVVLLEGLPDVQNEEVREVEVSARVEGTYGGWPLRLVLTTGRPPAWFGKLLPGETLVRTKSPGYGGVSGSRWGALSKR